MNIYVEGKFPGLNEILSAAKCNRYKYAKMKKDYTQLFEWQFKEYHFPKFGESKKVDIKFTWDYKNSRRDPDNIMAGQKFILDAMVNQSIITDDTGKYINSISHVFRLGEEDGVHIDVDFAL